MTSTYRTVVVKLLPIYGLLWLTVGGIITTNCGGGIITVVHAQETTDSPSSSTCQAEYNSNDGNCRNIDTIDVPQSYCSNSDSTDSYDIYQFGGSAQAYKPHVPISSVVCPADISDRDGYKFSSWPFSRRTSRTGSAPTMDIKLTLWSCSSRPNSSSSSDGGCRCSPFVHPNIDHPVVVEVWQTRPDGKYSTLTSSDGDDVCRATVPVDLGTSTATFSTVAPGSNGLMLGLEPLYMVMPWDSSPYGRPVIHILVNSHSHHHPLLLNIPIVPDPKTLGRRDFRFQALDWSGRAWATTTSRYNKEDMLPYNITLWDANVDQNHIHIEMDIYVPAKPEGEKEGKDDDTSSSELRSLFCRSPLSSVLDLSFLSPGTFFVEPIAICRRYLLDFFRL